MVKRFQFMAVQHPVRALALAGVFAFGLSWALASMLAGQWERKEIDTVFAESEAALSLRAGRVAEKAADRFAMLRNMAMLLASDSDWARALELPVLREAANAKLDDMAGMLRLHRTMLVDARGVCRASNGARTSTSLVGVNLADRSYVSDALAGKPGLQFVVGRISTVPGFHFSAPVRSAGKVVGVLGLKIDLPTLSDQLGQLSGFVTDAEGVVVAADDPGLLLTAVPGGAALTLDPEVSQRRYQRYALEATPLREGSLFGRVVHRVGESPNPLLLHVAKLPRQDLVVYGFEDLSASLAAVRQGYTLRLYTMFMGAFVVLFSTFGLILYLARDRNQRRELSQLNQELRELAQRDHLTGCHNRRSFDEKLEQEVLRSERNGQPFSLVFFDLDGFKSVNDTHGHSFGDAVLGHVASTCLGELRRIDMLARLGGDEFALIMPSSTGRDAREVVLRIMDRLSNECLSLDGVAYCQDVSAGVTQWRHGMQPEQLMLEADKALYGAKRSGKNRVFVHEA